MVASDGQLSAAPALPPPPPPTPVGRSSRASRKRRHRLRRRLLLVATFTLLLLALGAAWVAVRGLQARSELAAAQRLLPTLRSQIVQGDSAAAARSLAALTEETTRAHSLTDDPLWHAYARMPFVGESLRTSGGLASAAADLAQNVLPALVRAGNQLDPAHLRSGATLQLQAFVAAQPDLDRAAAQSKVVLAQVQALPVHGLVQQVTDARASLLTQLVTLVSSTRTAATAAKLAPDMLGANGPRTYFLAFQNNAEARGTGGLMGAFGVAVADKGTITVTRTGSDSELSQFAKPVVSLGAEYDGIYGASAETDLREANLSPHFPDAATIWATMWQRQSHHPVDGVLALDPVAMAGILDATGPATLPDGTHVTGANVVQLTEQQAYDQFTNPSVRKEFLQLVAHAMFAQLMTGGGSAKALLAGLGSAVGTGHLQLWSAHPAEQAQLATLPIAGELTSTPGPYAQLVVNNAAGGKLDYYLGRSLTYTAGACTTGLRDSTITVTLTNGAPTSGLSAYALTRADKPSDAYPPGQNRTLVSVYAALGARLQSATLDGAPVTMQSTSERGHPRFSRYLELDPASSGTLVLHLDEPSVAGGATVPVQPLVLPQATHVSVPHCR